MSTQIFIKNGTLSLGPDEASAIAAQVPRDAGMGAPALVWGLDRCTWCFNPLSVDCDGNLNVAFSGTVTLGAVTIKDDDTCTKLDVVCGEGRCMCGDNINGIPIIGMDPVCHSSFLHFDCSGYLLTNTCQNYTCISECTGTYALCTGNMVITSCFTDTPRKSSFIGVSIDNSNTREIKVSVMDGTTEYLLQCCTSWTGQNLIISDALRLSSTDGQIRICVNSGVSDCGTVSYLIISERC